MSLIIHFPASPFHFSCTCVVDVNDAVSLLMMAVQFIMESNFCGDTYLFVSYEPLTMSILLGTTLHSQTDQEELFFPSLEILKLSEKAFICPFPAQLSFNGGVVANEGKGFTKKVRVGVGGLNLQFDRLAFAGSCSSLRPEGIHEASKTRPVDPTPPLADFLL